MAYNTTDVQELPPVTLNAILVREDHPPDNVDEPIEWLLLINLPIESFDDAIRVVEWYCCRWQIEVCHKVIKSGCRVEDCRLQTADRLQNYIALMSILLGVCTGLPISTALNLICLVLLP
jgi:hypothetical protein